MNSWLKILGCAALSAVLMFNHAANTQTARAGEGLARQMTSIKNQMESFRNHVDGEISTITGQLNSVTSTVNSLQSTVNEMSTDVNRVKRCANLNKIYAPNHDNADNNGCRPDNRIQCKNVGWSNKNGKKGLELPSQGGERYMIHADSASVTKRCQERGYDYGFTKKVFTHKEWCRYSNANVKAYTGSSNRTGAHTDVSAWRDVSCGNPVSEAKCCKQIND